MFSSSQEETLFLLLRVFLVHCRTGAIFFLFLSIVFGSTLFLRHLAVFFVICPRSFLMFLGASGYVHSSPVFLVMYPTYRDQFFFC